MYVCRLLPDGDEQEYAVLSPRILQQNSLARHWAQDWARDWLALALTQVHHGSRLSDSCEGGEALSSVHPPTPATGKLIHDLLCDGRVKNDCCLLYTSPSPRDRQKSRMPSSA